MSQNRLAGSYQGDEFRSTIVLSRSFPLFKIAGTLSVRWSQQADIFLTKGISDHAQQTMPSFKSAGINFLSWSQEANLFFYTRLYQRDFPIWSLRHIFSRFHLLQSYQKDNKQRILFFILTQTRHLHTKEIFPFPPDHTEQTLTFYAIPPSSYLLSPQVFANIFLSVTQGYTFLLHAKPHFPMKPHTDLGDNCLFLWSIKQPITSFEIIRR